MKRTYAARESTADAAAAGVVRAYQPEVDAACADMAVAAMYTTAMLAADAAAAAGV
jgi:hypothetical protein